MPKAPKDTIIPLGLEYCKKHKKQVYRLCKELNVLRPQTQVKQKHPRKIAQNREITNSNALWEVDIKYGYIHDEDRFFYIASFLDVYDRNIVEFYDELYPEDYDYDIVFESKEKRAEKKNMEKKYRYNKSKKKYT